MLFATKNIETVKYFPDFFDSSLPSVLWAKRVNKFAQSFNMFTLSAL